MTPKALAARHDKEKETPMGNAFNKALALESIGEIGAFDAKTATYSGVTHDALVNYAKTVAYKVFHNIKLGHVMSDKEDPLTVDGVSAKDVWAPHFGPAVCQGKKCGSTDGISHSPECIVEAAEIQGWSDAPEAIAAKMSILRAEIKAIGAAAAAATKPTQPTYSYSTDDEIYHGEFDSPDAAAAEAFYDDPELEAVSVGENRKHTAHFYVSADRILEDVTERAYDECREASEDWLDGVMHNVDLKAELERLVGDWLQAQEPPNFWRVASTRQITRAEMVAAGKLDNDAA